MVAKPQGRLTTILAKKYLKWAAYVVLSDFRKICINMKIMQYYQICNVKELSTNHN